MSLQEIKNDLSLNIFVLHNQVMNLIKCSTFPSSVLCLINCNNNI